MKCRMDHIVLNVGDMETMIAFYNGVLELETERLREYRDGTVPFPSVRLNADTIIDLFPEKLWRRGEPDDEGRKHLNHICFALEQPAWNALRLRLEAGSVALEDGPVKRWGAHGTGISIYFRDPERNLIEARYYDLQDGSEKCLLGS